MDTAPDFGADFQAELRQLLEWRRDVRHFTTDPVDEDILATCLAAFDTAPSVGLSQPWRIVDLRSPDARAKALENFKACNQTALSGYDGSRAELYASLKLTGMQDAPIQLAVFCDETTPKGAGLGANTMPEMRRYSVVCAIMSFWMLARAHGLGLGWVSILDPDQLRRDLDLPADWALVGYLCLGIAAQDTETPELETAGWEQRAQQPSTLIKR
ncbi:5,6-dimethylbenzimidazole synthase [Amylibacter marinus]|uniref:5,6-dimethylbenzimidazole synthase n=1 Tax=Amylibacter marinus TaxID=1475483 RepID=A0ABQ5VWS6_9RHOB|nr:5,6-dimethylbenzimidazole synthase [Amylibacter marinus]GLQ35877.1 5,6-dimethylbenzimidazole synthase [Amylibacter marinus]